MSINIQAITHQIQDAGNAIADRITQHSKLIPAALIQLNAASAMQDLHAKAEIAAASREWSGAKPTGENVAATFPCPAQTPRATVIAVDGSQIYPDKHSALQYYLLNIGAFIIQIGSGEAPTVVRNTVLAASNEDVLVDGRMVTVPLVNLRRTVAEMEGLTELSLDTGTASPHPVVSLIDGPIALRTQGEGISARETGYLYNRHLKAMDRLADCDCALAGYVDQPGGSPVLNLLWLSSFEIDALDVAIEAKEPPFGGVSDRAVFQKHLGPGERSAIFQTTSGWNEPYRKRTLQERANQTHSIHIFYLNVSLVAETPVVVRVEIPEWIATNPEQIALLHATLVSQSQYTAGVHYPYALARADGEAVIQTQDRTVVENMLTRELLKKNIVPHKSAKLKLKGSTRPKRRKKRR